MGVRGVSEGGGLEVCLRGVGVRAVSDVKQEERRGKERKREKRKGEKKRGLRWTRKGPAELITFCTDRLQQQNIAK